MPQNVQQDVLDVLRRQLSAEGDVSDVTTHASHLLIGATRVFKLKRPIAYGYLDYSTPQKRLEAVRAELALNRRTAPSLYLGLHVLTRHGTGVALDGAGELVDAALEMKRFPEDCLLDRMAREHRLTRPLMSRLAVEIARLHAGAPIRTEETTERVERVLDINARAFAATGLLARAPDLQGLIDQCRATYARQQARLLRRARGGRVRHCHGDLTLRNICVLDGVPTPFDCLEFSEDLATTDVLYDLAFVLMDLWHRGAGDEANWLCNRYLDRMDEEQDAAVLPFFMAVRAMVRCHVAAARAQADASDEAWEEASSYARTASDLLRPQPARFVALGGFSGSGKSTVAAAAAAGIGAPPGARVLSSDRIRKAMFGAEPEARLPPEAYAPDVSERVYASLFTRAECILREGGSVIADAVFDRQDDRAALASLAARSGVALTAVWLETSAQVQAERVAARRADVSDATVEVLASQRERGHGSLSWPRFDASRPVEQIAQDLLNLRAT